MGRADYLKLGDWNALCDVCGRKFKASTLRLRWDSLRVCPGDWEPRQVQDFVRGIPERTTPPWTRPMPPDQFVGPACSPRGRSCFADVAVADCSICDNTSNVT